MSIYQDIIDGKDEQAYQASAGLSSKDSAAYNSIMSDSDASKEYLKLNGIPANDPMYEYGFGESTQLETQIPDAVQAGDYLSLNIFGGGGGSVDKEDGLRRYLAQSIDTETFSFGVNDERGFDLKGLMGAPFKFSRTDDPPLATGSEYGRSYLEQYIEHGNIVAFTPGVAYFLPGLSDSEREKWITNTANSEGKSDTELQLETEEARQAISEAGAKKLYTFRPASTMYWDYVNMIWRFLMKLSGLDEYESRIAGYFKSFVQGALENDLTDTLGLTNSNKLSSIRWGSVNESSDLNKLLYSFIGNSGMSRPEYSYSFVPFYVDGPNQVNEGFDNSSGESVLGSKLNSFPGEELSRELGFLSGYTYRDQNDYDMSAKDQTSEGKKGISQILSVKNFGVKTIVPDVWKDSGSAGREHTFRIKLACCDGTPESYAIHTLRALAHILAFSLPIHHKGNFAFAAPLLVRVFAKGLPTIDVGMITSLQIEKEPRSVTTYGLMTDMTVSITVKDLTPVIALPNNRKGIGAKSAIGFMSMIGGLTGCNVNLLDWTMLDLAIPFDSVMDYVSFNSIKQSVGNIASDVYGKIKSVWRGI